MSDQSDRAETELSRHVRAPIEAVFDALTDEAAFGRWWGPHGFDSTATLDPRPGGEVHIVMRAPDGTASRIDGSYREVSPPSRISMTLTAHDAEGDPIIAAEISTDLTEDADGTAIRVGASGRALRPEGRPGVAGMHEGWSQSLDRLQHLLEETRGATIKMRHDTV